jgi:hypothetical protein
MGVHDWFSRTGATPQPSVPQNTPQQAPQAVKVEDLPANVKAQAVEAAHPAAKLMDRAGQPPENPSAPSSRSDGREALIRNQGDQGKEQSAMSPTDHGRSQTATQERSQNRGRGMER